MNSPVRLRQLLIGAFSELQDCDANGTLTDFLGSACSFGLQSNVGCIAVIKTDPKAAASGWLLLSVIEANGATPGRNSLLITTEKETMQFGRGLLAMAMHGSSLRVGSLKDDDWSNISHLIQRIRDADISILSKGRLSALAFTARIEELVRRTAPSVLIIDQPRLCFPRRGSKVQLEPPGIPASLVALTETLPLHVICVETARSASGASRRRMPRVHQGVAGQTMAPADAAYRAVEPTVMFPQ